ncbi:hypothetical protein [Rathayibacter sp. Leaf296]|nr:hypothetical protein [Rathayibacter sp. Leaf296]
MLDKLWVHGVVDGPPLEVGRVDTKRGLQGAQGPDRDDSGALAVPTRR